MISEICINENDSISGSELNFLVISLCCGMICAIKFARDGYKYSRGCSYIDTVCKTVTYSIFGFYVGVVSIAFSPIIFPIGLIIAVVRMYEKKI